jgi:tetratricopeptide (TPR) repeat protein
VAQPTIARLSFTRLVIGACCLVLLSVCSVEAQGDLARFDVNSALSEGYRLLNEGRFDRAEAVFEDVITHDPKNRDAIEGLVWVAFSSGRYAEAGRAADKLRILDPQDIGWTRKWIEVVWHDPDRRGEALAEARSLLINDEDDVETRLLLAGLLSRDRQTWAEAATEYEKVLKRAPQNLQALIGRAHLAIWTGHLDDDAQRESLVSGLRKVLGEDDIEKRLLLAQLLSLDRQTWAEAVTEYEKVLQRAPQNVQALIERANLAIWTGHIDDVQRESLVSGLRKLPGVDDVETRLLIAQLLSLDPRASAEAVSEYENVLERVPNNVQALTGRARLAIWAGDLDNAYRFLQLARAVDPTSTVVAEQIESIKRAAKELSHSRMQLFVPLALTIIFLSIGVGYSTRELTGKSYLLLLLQVVILMGLAALWVYVPPTAIVPDSN